MSKSERIECYPSSGNVFADLGFENAEEMLVKSDLTIDIERVMKRRGIGEAEVAKVLGIPPAEVPFLLRGDFEEISVEALQQGLETLRERGQKGQKGQKGKKALRRQPGGIVAGNPAAWAAAGRE